MEPKPKVTPSLEDYLETIFFLYNKNGKVRVTDIAMEMSISKPSVNRAIKNLMSQNLVEHEHYGSLNLTDKGFEIAKDVALRHELIRMFLTDVLYVDNVTAEAEACLIEHSISNSTLEKLKAFLQKIL